MHRFLRRAALLAVAGLALAPIGQARAMHLSANGAVLLRYHYVAGQSYAYRMTLTMRVSMNAAGAGSSSASGPIQMTGSLHYHVLSVEPDGSALARISTTGLLMSMTINGKTATNRVPDQPATTIHLGADGSQQGSVSNSFGSYGVQALGNLPANAVAPGAHWTSSAVASIPSVLGPSLAPMHLTANNTFSKFVQADGYRAAAIDTTAALQYVTDATISGSPVHVHLTSSIQGQTLFGTTLGRLVSSQVHMDMRLFMSGHDATGGDASVHGHIVMFVALQPQGW